MATYYNPVRITFGSGRLQTIRRLAARQCKDKLRVLILTGAQSLKAAGHLATILTLLENMETHLSDGIPSNPDVADIFRIKKETDNFDYNLILAAGGGSVIDTGKALSALKHVFADSEDAVRSVIRNKAYLPAGHEPCPLWAVPTTAGTGSEVTSWATIWDQKDDAKYSITGTALYPREAIVDPALTCNLSGPMTASSALDALSHAAEAYWSKNTNIIVRMYAVKAITLIRKHLFALLNDLHNLPLRTQLAYGSLMAGLAFSNTKTTACHSISYPLTLTYGISHGVAVSMTLGQMLAKNETALVDKKELLQAFAADKPQDVTDWIHRIYAQAGLPGRLRDYGVDAADLSVLADKSYTPGRMDNNPVDVDKMFLMDLLKEIY